MRDRNDHARARARGGLEIRPGSSWGPRFLDCGTTRLILSYAMLAKPIFNLHFTRNDLIPFPITVSLHMYISHSCGI